MLAHMNVVALEDLPAEQNKELGGLLAAFVDDFALEVELQG